MKRIIALLLCVLLCVSMLPTAALAEEDTPTETTEPAPTEPTEPVTPEPSAEPEPTPTAEPAPTAEPTPSAEPEEEPETLEPLGDSSEYDGGDFGSFHWGISYPDGTLTITGTGVMPDYPSSSQAPWAGYTHSISSVVIAEGVTSLGAYSFSACDRIESVSFPAGLQSIGESAFEYCTWLTSVVFPTGLQSIGADAFRGSGLVYAPAIPLGASIGTGAFKSCCGLADDYDLVVVGGVLFDCLEESSPVLTANITRIDTYAFSSSLVSVTLPLSLRSVDAGAFANCTALQTVYYPGTLSDWSGVFVDANNARLEQKLKIQDDYGSYYSHLGHCGSSVAWGITTGKVLEIKGSGAMADYTSALDTPWYSYRSSFSELTVGMSVTRIGNYAFSSTLITSATLYGSQVSGFTGVSVIGQYAFSACSLLEDITFGSHLTAVEAYAFNGCTELMELRLPDSIQSMGTAALSGCTQLRVLRLPDSLTACPAQLCEDCATLLLIELPAATGSVGAQAFSGCGLLHRVYIGNPTVSIDSTAFSDYDGVSAVYTPLSCIREISFAGTESQWSAVNTTATGTVFPATATVSFSYDPTGGVLGQGSCGTNLRWTLYDTGELVLSPVSSGVTDACSMDDFTSANTQPWHGFHYEIRRVTMPSGLTRIGNNAFSGCCYITGVTMPAMLQSIGKSAFANCESLTSVPLGSRLTSIGERAFDGCAVNYVTMPDTVTSLGRYAYNACGVLKTVRLSQNLSVIPKGCFAGCKKLRNINIPSNVTAIENGAFSGCNAMSYVNFPAALQSIASSAFYHCDTLTSLSIPAGTLSIDKGAFQTCTGVTTLSLPGSVRTIGKNAFAGCPIETIAYDGLASEWASVTMDTGNEALTAEGVTISFSRFSVSYDANGGENAPDAQIKAAGTVLTLSAQSPTRTGYEFLGWAAESEGAVVYQPEDDYTTDADLTLYAVWQGKPYTVSFNGQGADTGSMVTMTVLYGETFFLPANAFSWGSCGFLGWAASPGGEVVYSDGESVSNLGGSDCSAVTLYAVWDLPVYTISFSANGGENAPEAVQKLHGTTVQLPAQSPTRSGYLFSGWALSPQSATADYLAGAQYSQEGTCTLYAVWDLPVYTISFSANGGQNAPASVQKVHGTTVQLPAQSPTRSGYIFCGWALSRQSTTAGYMAGAQYSQEGSRTLYAVWATRCTVSYDANGGIGAPASQTKYINKTLRLSSVKPTRTGYSFLGWATTPGGAVAYKSGAYYKLNAPVMLSAVWQAKTYKVTYNANGGKSAPAAQLKTYAQTLTLSGTRPVRSGYSFLGWSLSRSGSIAYSPRSAYTENKAVTLYAIWQADTYSVTFCADGGDSVPAPQEKIYGKSLRLSSVKPTRTGYTFLGYALTAGGAVKYTAGSYYKANGPAELHCIWRINTYSVSYNANGGRYAPTSHYKTYGQALTLKTQRPSRTGHRFLGWSLTKNGPVNYQPGDSYTSDAACILYAVWLADTYSVTYVADGGRNAPASQTKTYGKSLRLSSDKPTRTGYTFSGWALTEGGRVKYKAGAYYSTNGPVELHAVWKLETYKISYNANGGGSAPSYQYKTYGKPLTLRTSVPRRSGYTFVGWALSSTATEAVYKPGVSYTAEGNQTLYAVWKR